MKICMKCGAPLKDDEKWCWKCGATAEKKESKKDKKKKKKK